MMNFSRTIARGILLAALCLTTAVSSAQIQLGTDDRGAIRQLMTAYAQALADCRAEDFADLFVPGTGYFASGFRGHIVGRERLIDLVESERHCLAAADSPQRGRPGGAGGPAVEIRADASGVYGVADLGTAEYQDEYARTPAGWRFASRTVIVAAEKAAGLDARSLLALQRLGGDELGDYYVPDDSGVPRLRTSGVAVSVTGSEVSGRAYLRDGGYRDEVYERTAAGEWRVGSSTYHAPGSD